MVKLIVTDMDHTLLNEKSQLPVGFERVVQTLEKQGIRVVLASGRALYNIKLKVKDVDADFFFISDNGALVEHNGELIYKSLFSKDDTQKIVDVCRNAKNTTIVATTVSDQAYVEIHHGHEEHLHEFYPGYQIVDNLLELDEEFTRITLMSHDNIENFENITSKNLGEDYLVVQSGEVWTDITHLGVNKGNALEKLANVLDIESHEIIAFGDYNNDISMLEYVGHSYAVSNATAEVKAVADEIIGSNDTGAVINKMKEFIQ